MDSVISLHGESFEIHGVTFGAEGSYGDRAQTWAKKATETVWLQRPGDMASSRAIESIITTIAGEMDESSFIGYFKFDSVVAKDNFLLKDGVKYDVLNVVAVKVFQNLSHLEAHVKQLEEG